MEVTPGSSSRSGMTYSSPQTPSNPFRSLMRGLANTSPQIVEGVNNADLVDVLVDVSHRVYNQAPNLRSMRQVARDVEPHLKQNLRNFANRIFAPYRVSRYSRGSRRRYWLKRPYHKK